jgi:tRNA threonylcarbamoyladenosine biosynthesis protein TsaE
MRKIFEINSREDTILLGEKIGSLAFPNMLITMNGDLGAGKTTMTKGIAKGLEIEGIINSPTFTIMKIYEGKYTLYHLDVYRITNSSDDFELEEYFENDGVCVIEWAEQIKDLIPENRLDIIIKDLGDEKRLIELVSNGIEYDNIIEGL